MNKRAKGAIAAGGAAVLLLGGLGSLAYWSDSESTGGANISSGQLSLTTPTDAAWFDVTGTGEEVIADINAFQIVPGDVVEYRATVVVNATGENLEANLTADGGGLTPMTGTALADAIDVTFSAEVGGTPLPETDGGTYTVTSADNGDTIDLVVTMTFDPTTPLEVAQNEAVSLADFTIDLQQVQQA
jgi:alternate signal-mediated exported protein